MSLMNDFNAQKSAHWFDPNSAGGMLAAVAKDVRMDSCGARVRGPLSRLFLRWWPPPEGVNSEVARAEEAVFGSESARSMLLRLPEGAPWSICT